MEKEYITNKETITLFLQRTLSDLKNENEVPKLNIIFPDSAFELFEYVKNHPFTKEGWFIPELTDEEIEKAKIENQNDLSEPTVYVKNPKRFFELLTKITNSWIDLKGRYHGSGSGRNIFIMSIKRIWLRMSPNDFLDIENFLEKQLSFIKNTTFDELIGRETLVGNYQDNNIYASKHYNSSWCETDNKVMLIMKDNEGNVHSLPSIHFAVTKENEESVCYIYAIQNEPYRKTDKKMSRQLYKLNSGVTNPEENPGSLLSLITFINMLKRVGITKVKVPALQVLSYRYHELLSKHTKESFEKKWTEEYLDYVKSIRHESERNRLLNRYEEDKLWYDHVVDKQDFISENKTEKLYNLFFRLSEQFGLYEITTYPFIEDENLTLDLTNQNEVEKTSITK